MRMIDLIEKKKRGETLDKEEIHFMIQGFVSGEIPDYQMSAMLMAVCFQGMTPEETSELTWAMEYSGDVIDLSPVAGCKVDKHSTGGVGDKTTLILAPIVAACGGRVAKMSGRGLGHTGGTIDKLESIPGFCTSLDRETFFRIVNEIGLCVIGQTGNLVPADKKLYALRDVTATVDCIPLIASSIMSKKLAAGSDAILLDVKTGSGAFMKMPKEAAALAEAMVAIGTAAGRRVAAMITEMDIPLGRMVGNALEVKEAISVLKGEGPEDLVSVCHRLAGEMLLLSGKAEPESVEEQVTEAIDSGRALERFKAMVKAQGGNSEAIDHPELLPKASFTHIVKAKADGYVRHMDTEGIGIASMLLGAGRSRKEDSLDYGAGVELCKKTGDIVHAGEPLAILYASQERLFEESEARLLASYEIGDEKPLLRQKILARTDADGTKFFI
ncbi:pyrimidine-nucleoside phosphorylase [Hominifimenecus sp. rT4P-3]|uniref:pyrimidine-nucleoside phosphorylase n=1 Tax=Hominifimenecus sp. rT4P-3 TaxID=3242979 RepID=UPI003DA37A56